jgi:hypothetical protein
MQYMPFTHAATCAWAVVARTRRRRDPMNVLDMSDVNDGVGNDVADEKSVVNVRV